MACSVVDCELFFLHAPMRTPLKFGASTMTEAVLARVCIRVRGRGGREAAGWGETPLSAAWGWPGPLAYERRLARMQHLAQELISAWKEFDCTGHPLEMGHGFLQDVLPGMWSEANRLHQAEEPMPWLAALIVASAFDLALHDAYGNLHDRPTYELYGRTHLTKDLADFLEPAPGSGLSFRDRYPSDFMLAQPEKRIPVWHLVGGLDPLDDGDLNGSEPDDGYPVLLRDWISRDGLRCLKVKLRGNDAGWDFERLCRVGDMALSRGVLWLSADFNCTAPNVNAVVEVLQRLLKERPEIFARLLYVEQPFPYELEAHPYDVRPAASLKPLFMDESAHDWEMIRLGRSLGWSGVALKTCKTQTGAILSACWALAHGMPIMVQDLTNPSLAMISHAQLAAHFPTIWGIESNACQFYPEFSRPEAEVHPGLYCRRDGVIDLSSVRGPGLGYRIESIGRTLHRP